MLDVVVFGKSSEYTFTHRNVWNQDIAWWRTRVSSISLPEMIATARSSIVRFVSDPENAAKRKNVAGLTGHDRFPLKSTGWK
jgi:hypothetical protein